MHNKTFYSLKYLLIALLLGTVALPTLWLLATIRPEHIRAVLGSAQFLPMLTNSLVTALAATAISVTLSFGLAWLLNRSNIRFKSVFVVLFTVPMLIPSISHGMGLVLLLGDNGLLTRLLGLGGSLYGYPGIVLGSVLYSFPVAFLMFQDSFQYEDYTVYEAAQALGLSRWRQFLTITLPSMGRTILSAVSGVDPGVLTECPSSPATI